MFRCRLGRTGERIYAYYRIWNITGIVVKSVLDSEYFFFNWNDSRRCGAESDNFFSPFFSTNIFLLRESDDIASFEMLTVCRPWRFLGYVCVRVRRRRTQENRRSIRTIRFVDRQPRERIARDPNQRRWQPENLRKGPRSSHQEPIGRKNGVFFFFLILSPGYSLSNPCP